MNKNKHGNCPQCGGPLRAEALGWRCDNCRGFISMNDGKFYEYKQKPFLPPMTNGDAVRTMSDEDLAKLFVYHEYEVAKKIFAMLGTDITTIPYDFEGAEKEYLERLRQPVKEDR